MCTQSWFLIRIPLYAHENYVYPQSNPEKIILIILISPQNHFILSMVYYGASSIEKKLIGC